MQKNTHADLRPLIEAAVRKTFEELGVETFRATEFFMVKSVGKSKAA